MKYDINIRHYDDLEPVGVHDVLKLLHFVPQSTTRVQLLVVVDEQVRVAVVLAITVRRKDGLQSQRKPQNKCTQTTDTRQINAAELR